MTGESEQRFLERMAKEAAHETDSGHTMVDRDDLLRLVKMASRNRAKWMLAQRGLNKIDGGFEYRYGDDKARKFVHGVLAEYTDAIKGSAA